MTKETSSYSKSLELTDATTNRFIQARVKENEIRIKTGEGSIYIPFDKWNEIRNFINNEVST